MSETFNIYPNKWIWCSRQVKIDEKWARSNLRILNPRHSNSQIEFVCAFLKEVMGLFSQFQKWTLLPNILEDSHKNFQLIPTFLSGVDLHFTKVHFIFWTPFISYWYYLSIYTFLRLPSRDMTIYSIYCHLHIYLLYMIPRS